MSIYKELLYKILYKLSPQLFYQFKYWLVRRKFICFSEPTNLSEYILSEMTKKDFESFSIYADKIAVRKYVESKKLGDILPILYGVWNNVEDIDFDSIPNTFALKTNHGCGSHVICHDKAKLNINSAKAIVKKALHTVYNIYEPQYKCIPPKVYAEELINDGTGNLPVDYKFMCVNGEPKCILVCSERGEKKLPTKTIYDLEWNKLPWTRKCVEDIMLRPCHLEEMIEIAKVLSKDFKFVRVDLYDCPNKIYFSELTFSPAEGILSTFTIEALEQMNPNKAIING